MSKFDEIIDMLKAEGYSQKQQLLEYLVQLAESAGNQFSREDKEAVLAYAYEEVDSMVKAIREAESYKEKDIIFACENALMGIIMNLIGSPAMLPPEKLLKIKALTELVDQERYIEKTLDSIFEQSTITKIDINRLLYWVKQTTDEYQKSMLFLGFVHHQKEMSKLDSDAKTIIADYTASEIHRLMALGDEDAWNALELIADVSKNFADEKVIDALKEMLRLGHNHINVYAVETLYGFGEDVPQTVIDALAMDLEYANTAYHILERQGKTALFPAECTTEEYLAKSDMVRWLTYPTELGKAPDEIVYIGKIRQLFKKEVFHVFKYRSNSETLSDDLKNQWLVGWSSNGGSTFSNFDKYAPFEKETTEKALKMIKKRLIG